MSVWQASEPDGQNCSWILGYFKRQAGGRATGVLQGLELLEKRSRLYREEMLNGKSHGQRLVVDSPLLGIFRQRPDSQRLKMQRQN